MAGIEGITGLGSLLQAQDTASLRQATPQETLSSINRNLGQMGVAGASAPSQVDAASRPSFDSMLSDLVNQVDAKQKTGHAEARKLMSGESDNLHGSMIAMQEASVAFTLLVETRNKLVESYQEIMRMQV
ncbi:MAG: flagellar hook-basal body complex protein FliE [Opitutales bacterium]